jgi:hypothetical protein
MEYWSATFVLVDGGSDPMFFGHTSLDLINIRTKKNGVCWEQAGPDAGKDVVVKAAEG